MATNQPTNDQRVNELIGLLSNQTATYEEREELTALLQAKHEAIGEIISQETANGTKIEQLAAELLRLHLREVPIAQATDVQLGDALRGALMAISTQVVWQLDKRGQEYQEDSAYPNYPYTSEAIMQVSAVTS